MGTADPDKFAALVRPAGTLRILHCGDSDIDDNVVRRLLRQSRTAIDFCHVSDRASYVAALGSGAIDIVLCDFLMADFDGSDALRLARASSPTMPFIFLSGTAGEDGAIESLRIGATDCVPKDRLGRLGATVDRALREAAVRQTDTAATLELAEHRRLLAGVLEAVPDFVYAVDRENRLVACNARASAAFFGNAAAEMIRNTPLADLEPPGIDIAAMLAENSSLMAQGREVRDQERYRIDLDGAERCLEVSKTLLREGNATEGLVVVVRDITERVILERAVLEVIEQEQRRIGSDLHDGLGQELSALRLLLTALEQSIPAEATGAHERLRRAQEVLYGAVLTTGRLARGLAPADLDQATLSSALATLVERSTATFGVTCRFDDRSGGTLTHIDGAVATHLYRIAQEAVGNAARHGSPDTIDVVLGATPDSYVEVRDNGSGFDAGTLNVATGMGLRLMKYRAHLIGAVVTVSSGPDGTVVRCQFKQALPLAGPGGRRTALDVEKPDGENRGQTSGTPANRHPSTDRSKPNADVH